LTVILLEEAGDQRPDLVWAVKQDQVSAAAHRVQPGPRHQRGYDPVIHMRCDGVVVAGALLPVTGGLLMM